MTVYYIDPLIGNDGADGLSEATPKYNIPSPGADGDIYYIRRGREKHLSAQYDWGNRTGIIVADYGPPDAPKPIISAEHAAGVSTMNLRGDFIFANINFKGFQRSSSETTSSNVGQNAILAGVRGNAAQGTAEGVSALFFNCDFQDIGNNAITFVGIGGDSQAAWASPIAVILGCSFKDIGGDAFNGSVRDYLEFGWNRVTNIGNRIDPSITGIPAGGRRSAADAVGLLYANPAYVWIHDNFIDHRDWDCKHSIMLDTPASPTGLAVIERNIILGYGSSRGSGLQSVNNAGINTDMRAIIRNNYIRGSRLLINMQASAVGTEIYSNIFDVCAKDATLGAAVLTSAPKTVCRNNLFRAETPFSGQSAFKQLSSAVNSRSFRNIFSGFDKPNDLNTSVGCEYFQNGFHNCANRNTNGGVVVADGAGDYTLGADDVRALSVAPVSPPNISSVFSDVDTKVPNFLSQFGSYGLGYISGIQI